MLGPLVLNVANRDAGTLAVMAATFQEVSGGRLLLGVGAGGGADTPYAAEQRGLGRQVPGDRRRRSDVADTVSTLRTVWTGASGGVAGYLRPDPVPPVIVGGFGPRMAELAGRIGDGINCPPSLVDRLVPIARRARAAAGGDPDAFIVTTSADPTGRDLDRLAGSRRRPGHRDDPPALPRIGTAPGRRSRTLNSGPCGPLRNGGPLTGCDQFSVIVIDSMTSPRVVGCWGSRRSIAARTSSPSMSSPNTVWEPVR